MTTANHKLTSAWVNVSTARGLTIGTTYNIMVLGGDAHVADSAAEPTLVGRRYRDGAEFPYKAKGATSLWAKGSGVLVIDEVE